MWTKELIPYRNSTQIVSEIVTLVQNSGQAGIQVTPLCQKANLAHSRLRTFLTTLTGSGLINKITYLFLRLFSLFLSLIPRSINILFGKIFGILMCYFFPLRTSVAKINLKIAFPDKNKKEISKLILDTYKHYGILTFEFLRLHSSKINNNIFIIDNESKDILTNKSGIILMTAHILDSQFYCRLSLIENYPYQLIQWL